MTPFNAAKIVCTVSSLREIQMLTAAQKHRAYSLALHVYQAMHGARVHKTSRRDEIVRDPRRDAETY